MSDAESTIQKSAAEVFCISLGLEFLDSASCLVDICIVLKSLLKLPELGFHESCLVSQMSRAKEHACRCCLSVLA